MKNTEFYIGWMPKAPEGFAKQVRKTLFVLFPLALIVGLVLASFQKKFSTANFEFGKSTEVKGIYFNSPMPMLKVLNGKPLNEKKFVLEIKSDTNGLTLLNA